MTSSSSYTAATAPARRPSCCLGCSQWHATASSISIAQSAAVAIGAGNDERPVDLCVALGRLMGPLSEQDQHALRAVELQGMSQKEYADSLGLNYTTAKSRIQRARKPLRREFDRCCEIILDRRGAPIECTPRRKSTCC